MKNDLIKRYIYAVLSHLPTKEQPEVEKELVGMIDDMLEVRCHGETPTDKDIKVVLTELGTPEELAVKYSGDENKALLNGIYFMWFKRTMKMIIPLVAMAVTFALVLTAVIEWIQSGTVVGTTETQATIIFIITLVGKVIAGVISAIVWATACILFVCIIMERRKTTMEDSDFLSGLLPVPARNARIKISEPIVNIFFQIVFVVILLVFPQILGMYQKGEGWTSVFNANYIHAFWYIVLAWTVVGIICEVVMLAERRYSWRLAIATIVTNIIEGALLIVFFANSQVMNPDFADKLKNLVGTSSGTGGAMLIEHLNIVFLAVAIVALLIEIGNTTYRAFKYDKASS